MQESIMERLDVLEDENGQMSYDKQLGILGAEKVFSSPRQDDSSDFKTITDIHHDEMEAISEMKEGTQLIIGGINSIVDTMKTEVFKVRIMNAVNDLIRPLRDQMEILHLQDRIHAAEQHTDSLYYYRGIIQAISTLGTPNGGILNALMLEYRRFTNNPLWSTLRLTMTKILLPMVRGVSNLLFGTGDRRSVEQKILDAIKQQTELMRTGQIDQSQGFFQRFREQGIVGMGARAVGGAVANQYFDINRDRAQEREQQRADGEQVDGGVANWLTDRLFKNQTTLLDRTLNTSSEKNSESLVQQLRDVVLKVTLVDDDYKPVESVTEKTTETKQVSLIKETLKDAHEGIKQDFRSLVENTKSVYSVAKEQFFKAAEYSREAMFVGEVAERQDRAPIDLQNSAANDEITVKAVVGGEKFETLTDSVNRTNRHMTNMIDTTVQHRDEEMLQMYNISKQNDSVIRTQIEMQEAANDDLADLAEINRSQFKVQQRTRRAIMLGNMMKLVGTIAGGVLDVVKGIGGLAAALVGAKAARGVFGGGGRGGRPAGRMPVRGFGIAGIAAMGAGLITDRFTEEGTTERRVGDTASSALGWGATGAMVGSVIPGIGTAVGGTVGAVAGALYANRDKFEGVIDGTRDTVTNIGSNISQWWSGTDEVDGVFDRISSRVSTIGDSISNWWSGTDDTDGVFDRISSRVSTIGDSISNWWSGTDDTDGVFDRISSRVSTIGDRVTNIGSNISQWWSGTDEVDGVFDRISSRVSTIGDSISNWWSNLTSEGVSGRVIDHIKENNAFSMAARGGRKVLDWVRGDDDSVDSESGINAGADAGIHAATQAYWRLERGDVDVPVMMDRYRTTAEGGQAVRHARQDQQEQQRWLTNRAVDAANTAPQLLAEREAIRQGVNVGGAIDERGVQNQQQTVSLDGIINVIESTNKESANKSQEELNALGEIREILNSILNVSKDANKKKEGGNTPARVSPFDQSTISNVFGG